MESKGNECRRQNLNHHTERNDGLGLYVRLCSADALLRLSFVL